MGELKECPFCNGIAKYIFINHGNHMIECVDCHARVNGPDKETVEANWNTRPAPEAVDCNKCAGCQPGIEKGSPDCLSIRKPASYSAITSNSSVPEAVGFEDHFKTRFPDPCISYEVKESHRRTWQAAQAAQPSTLRRDLELLNNHFSDNKCEDCPFRNRDGCRYCFFEDYIDKIEQLLTKLREGK